MLILAGRVAPESKDNSVLFPLNTFTGLNERNIVMLTEQFKPIKDYEGFYEVSNFGDIKSLKRKGCSKDRMLKSFINGDGYKFIDLKKNGERKTEAIHRLVWDAFGDKPRNGHKLQVDHFDGNKLNNNIDNLQLLTNRENCSKGHQQNGRGLPTGVKLHQSEGRVKRYQARAYYNGGENSLGYYLTCEEASEAYQNFFRRRN